MDERTITDQDISAIIKAMQDHTCRYTVTPSDLSEAVRFFKNISDILEDSKKTIRKTVIVLIITGICGLICIGFWQKLKGAA